MPTVPNKVADRLIAGIKQFQPILAAAKARDAGEADTVTIIKDMLQDVFGYNKYSDVTSEHAIKGTYCDLAIKLDNILQTLIEVKAIGIELKDLHVKQAVDYAANQGVTWVVLTNGTTWRIYKVIFEKPIGQDLVVDIDFMSLKPKNDFEHLYLWCKEAWGASSALDEFEARKQALSRFLIGAVILSDPVLDVIRRELRRVSQLSKASADVKIDTKQIQQVLEDEVIKREVLEGAKANEASRKIAKAAGKLLKKCRLKKSLPLRCLKVLRTKLPRLAKQRFRQAEVKRNHQEKGGRKREQISFRQDSTPLEFGDGSSTS